MINEGNYYLSEIQKQGIKTYKFNMNIGIKLKRIEREDLIWFIYLFIAIFALISDAYEKNYILTNNKKSQKLFKTINITVLCIAFFIYLYFVLINYEDLKQLKKEATNKEVIKAKT